MSEKRGCIGPLVIAGVIVSLITVYCVIVFGPKIIDFYKKVKDNRAVAHVYEQFYQCNSYYKNDKKEFISSLKKIDVSECPSDFRFAFYDFVEAAEDYISYQESGTLLNPVDSKIDDYILIYNKRLDELNSVTRKYVKISNEKSSND